MPETGGEVHAVVARKRDRAGFVEERVRAHLRGQRAQAASTKTESRTSRVNKEGSDLEKQTKNVPQERKKALISYGFCVPKFICVWCAIGCHSSVLNPPPPAEQSTHHSFCEWHTAFAPYPRAQVLIVALDAIPARPSPTRLCSIERCSPNVKKGQH